MHPPGMHTLGRTYPVSFCVTGNWSHLHGKEACWSTCIAPHPNHGVLHENKGVSPYNKPQQPHTHTRTDRHILPPPNNPRMHVQPRRRWLVATTNAVGYPRRWPLRPFGSAAVVGSSSSGVFSCFGPSRSDALILWERSPWLDLALAFWGRTAGGGAWIKRSGDVRVYRPLTGVGAESWYEQYERRECSACKSEIDQQEIQQFLKLTVSGLA